VILALECFDTQGLFFSFRFGIIKKYKYKIMSTTPKEKVIMGTLLMGTVLIGVSLTCLAAINANGRNIPADKTNGLIIFILAVVTLVASIIISKKIDQANGIKIWWREAMSGLFAGAIGGFLLGFFLRSIFGRSIIFALIVIYAAAAYFVYTLSKKEVLLK
jgi:hypothetical protein